VELGVGEMDFGLSLQHRYKNLTKPVYCFYYGKSILAIMALWV